MTRYGCLRIKTVEGAIYKKHTTIARYKPQSNGGYSQQKETFWLEISQSC